MMYDVTRFDGGVRHTGVCHLTPDIWRGSVTTCPAQAWVPTPPQRAFDEPVLPLTSAVAAGPAVRVRLRAGSWMNIRTARSLFTSSHARHTLWRGGVPASPPAALIGHVHPSRPS
jgi:hypothetical protein